MNIAVLLYQDTDNPQNVPGNWPARTEPWNNQQAPWRRMTRQELAAWKQTYRVDYNTWKNARDYNKSYLKDRYQAYPSVENHLTAIVQMAEALFPDSGTMPPLMQQIIDERNAVDQRFPTPPN